MNRDELYQKMLDIAIKYGVELTDKAYNIAKVRCMLGVDLDKCICEQKNKERYCISKKCFEDIKENGVCYCNAFKKIG